jgi:hypothetical protein
MRPEEYAGLQAREQGWKITARAADERFMTDAAAAVEEIEDATVRVFRGQLDQYGAG